MDDFGEVMFGCLGLLFVIGLALLIAALVVDGWQERRAFPAVAACKQQRLEPVRQTFGTSVVCVPVNTRQDTTTVNINAKTDR